MSRRYVVISENTSDDETYIDYVQAKNPAQAVEQVSDVRGPETDGHLALTETSVFTADELRGLADELDEMPDEQIRNWLTSKEQQG